MRLTVFLISIKSIIDPVDMKKLFKKAGQPHSSSLAASSSPCHHPVSPPDPSPSKTKTATIRPSRFRE